MLDNFAAIAGAGLGVGLIASCWGQVKQLLMRVVGLLIVQVTFRNEASPAVAALLNHRFKQMRTSFPTYVAVAKFVRPLNRTQHVGYEMLSEVPTLFWDGWRPLIARLVSKPQVADYTTVTFLRWTFDPEAFLVRAMDEYNAVRSTWATDSRDRYRVIRVHGSGRGRHDNQDDKPAAPVLSAERDIYRPVGWSSEQLGMPSEGRAALDSMALSAEVLDAAQEAQRWFDSQSWYRERRIPWRRGWLLHGRPGTGKTTFVCSIAQSLGMPVYSFDIGSMSNQEFSKHWQQALSNSPAIVLIEDIDAVFHGRENVLDKMGGGLSFDSLLNTIGGIENTDGILLVVTTNNVDKIDPALGIPNGGVSSRPGRLDRMIELKEPGRDGRLKIASRILAGMDEDQITAVVDAGTRDTGAQFQERCSSVALQHYWANRGLKAAG
ncbi:MAG: ATP-binding protein [Planctomycetes bacterium]|nr:ATP-binding protein [Planctomycetota bacterium]